MRSTPGQGFFQLVTVSALVLLLLLSAHWLLRKDALKTESIFHGLAGVQIALLFVIMASAVQRMRLYQSEYGLTELRLYTMAFMGWLFLVCVWFCATVLRERRERFVFGRNGVRVLRPRISARPQPRRCDRGNIMRRWQSRAKGSMPGTLVP